ncbi:MAG: glycosyltransferase [bacterium]|nr:glycosyltransferase [bacterium]
MPELTVVMPIRNEADQIGSVLDQLHEQSLPPERFEILVVDGMSEDGTREIVQAMMGRRPGIRMFDNPRGLSGIARNIGVQHATTPYILFVDGHCRIESREMLATALVAFRRGERCLSRPQPLIGAGGRPFQTAASLARGSFLGHYAGSKIYEAADRHCNPLSAGCGYARDLYLELGGVDESFDAGEDLEFNLRVHQRGVMALHCHDLALAYLARPTWRDPVPAALPLRPRARPHGAQAPRLLLAVGHDRVPAEPVADGLARAGDLLAPGVADVAGHGRALRRRDPRDGGLAGPRPGRASLAHDGRLLPGDPLRRRRRLRVGPHRRPVVAALPGPKAGRLRGATTLAAFLTLSQA